MIAIWPKGKADKAFVEVLKAHKKELLPWLVVWWACKKHLAKQVLLGEFEPLVVNERDDLVRLLDAPYPLLTKAVEYLQSMKLTNSK